MATTRLETLLGDTGIAVHPDDERYKHLIGAQAVHPFSQRLIPIIADEFVQRQMGTGGYRGDNSEYCAMCVHLEFILKITLF